MNERTTIHPIERATVMENEVQLFAKGERFIVTEQDIRTHFEEGWLEDESVLIMSNDIVIELYPKDYRMMFKLLHPFG